MIIEIPTDIIEDISRMDIAELWNIIQHAEPENEEDEEKLKQIEEGINMKINMEYIANNWYKIYPNNMNIEVDYYGLKDITEFMKELRAREKLIREIIYESIDKEQLEAR